MVSECLACLLRIQSSALASDSRKHLSPCSIQHITLSCNGHKMFARCIPRQAARRAVKSIRATHQMPMKRRYSNSSVTPPAIAPSPAAALGGLNTELDKLSPRFDISSSQIEILRSPSDFYETLKASQIACFFFLHFFRLVSRSLRRTKCQAFIIYFNVLNQEITWSDMTDIVTGQDQNS